MFLIVAGIIVLYQVTQLYQVYHEYGIKTEHSTRSEDQVKPPYFTVCFNIMQMLNVSKIFQRHPNILAQVKAIKSTQEEYRNWSYTEILTDFDVGEGIILGSLNLAQISKIVVPLSSILEECSYLTENLVRKQCKESHFIKSFYDQSVCYTLGAFSHNELPMFQSKEIQVPGYRGLILFDLHLNLTSYSGINRLSLAIHPYPFLPWYDGFDSFEIFPREERVSDYALTYRKEVLKSLAYPYKSGCSDHFGESAFFSVSDCYSKCLIRKFVHKTKRYPRYYVISKFDRYKMMNGYSEREKYLNMSSRFYQSCRKICGRSDCKMQHFKLSVINKPKFYPNSGRLVVIHLYPPPASTKYRQDKSAITLANLFASTGSVISMWFNWSFLTILTLGDRYLDKIIDKSIKIIQRLYHRRTHKVFPLPSHSVIYGTPRPERKAPNEESSCSRRVLTRFNANIYGTKTRDEPKQDEPQNHGNLSKCLNSAPILSQELFSKKRNRVPIRTRNRFEEAFKREITTVAQVHRTAS